MTETTARVGFSDSELRSYLESHCLVLTGPSGVGKTTVTQLALEQCAAWKQCITATTRAPRGDEADGVHYHFLQRNDFVSRIYAGSFLEYAEVYDNFYGSPLSEVQAACSEGKFLVIVVDTVGCLSIRARWPGVPLLGLLPPSPAALRERLSNRDNESPAQVEQRLTQAYIETSRIRSFDFAIINDKLADAVNELTALLRLIETGMLSVGPRVDRLLQQMKENNNEA